MSVDAPSDKVTHYGSADSVNIIAVAASSYHENGVIGFAKIKKGRLVIEIAAAIDGVYLQDTNGAYNNIKLAVVGTAVLPSIARSDVELTDGGKQVLVEIQNIASSSDVDGSPEFIWLENNAGVISTVISASSTSSTEPVAQPSAAANAVKDEAKESATPIDENSQARIGAVGYATLVDAVNAINNSENGGTIVILKDLDFSTSTYSSYNWDNPLSITANNVVLDLNNKVISNMGNAAIRLGNMLTAQGRYSNITVKNGTLRVGSQDGVAYSYALAIGGVDGVLVKNVTTYGGINAFSQASDVVIEDCEVQGSKYYTVCAQVGSHVVIRGKPSQRILTVVLKQRLCSGYTILEQNLILSHLKTQQAHMAHLL